MKRSFLLISSLTLFTFLLPSCKSNGGKENPPVIEDLFTITWKNYDGTVLETDNNVKKGVIPTYDRATPTKPSDTQFTYTFKGWNPEIGPVMSNQIYIATFTSEKIITEEEKYATKPIVSSDGKTIKYGLYPQKNVNDEALVSTLNALTTAKSNGWYLYDNEYYAKIEAKPYKTTYFFDDGTPIVKGQTYWFKCEPIVWKILNKNVNEYFILSDVLIDAHCFYNSNEDRTIGGKNIYANNYKYSDIRTWLNNDFYNSAFALGNTNIKLTTVDNSLNTIKGDDPKYICENTEDKVYLPSYKDYLTPSYGFKESETTSLSRYCRTTDWARARGSLSSNKGEQYPNNGSYFTRSPNNSSLASIWGPSTMGELVALRVYDKETGFRPSISIKIS